MTPNISEHNENSFIIQGVQKNKYINISKQVDGKWLTGKKGWVVSNTNKDTFSNLLKVIFPDDYKLLFPEKELVTDSHTIETVEEKSQEENHPTTPSTDKISVLTEPPPVQSKNKKYRRSRSRSRNRNKEGGEINLQEDTEDVDITPSSSEYDSESSEDYPVRSPSRRNLANDEVLDKMEKVRRRLFQMDMEERRKKNK